VQYAAEVEFYYVVAPMLPGALLREPARFDETWTGPLAMSRPGVRIPSAPPHPNPG
jgi:hypothetical protein